MIEIADEADDIRHWHGLAVAETLPDGFEVMWKDKALATEARALAAEARAERAEAALRKIETEAGSETIPVGVTCGYTRIYAIARAALTHTGE